VRGSLDAVAQDVDNVIGGEFTAILLRESGETAQYCLNMSAPEEALEG
jgi:hypothetical protein